MIVLVRKTIFPRITDLTMSSAGIGILNTLGNKGGVAIRFRVDDTRLCFVNCHLQAFDNMTEKRNADHYELIRRLTFLPDARESNLLHPGFASVFNCDALFWFVRLIISCIFGWRG